MRKRKRPSKEIVKLFAYCHEGSWFYYFDYWFVRYSSNKGYATREEAEKAGREHIARAE